MKPCSACCTSCFRNIVLPTVGCGRVSAYDVHAVREPTHGVVQFNIFWYEEERRALGNSFCSGVRVHRVDGTEENGLPHQHKLQRLHLARGHRNIRGINVPFEDF